MYTDVQTGYVHYLVPTTTDATISCISCIWLTHWKRLDECVRTRLPLAAALLDRGLGFLPRGRLPASEFLLDRFWPLCNVHAPGKPLFYQTRSIRRTLAITHSRKLTL